MQDNFFAISAKADPILAKLVKDTVQEYGATSENALALTSSLLAYTVDILQALYGTEEKAIKHLLDLLMARKEEL